MAKIEDKEENSSTPRAISPTNSFNNKDHNPFYNNDCDNDKEKMELKRKESQSSLLNFLSQTVDKPKIDENDGNLENFLISSNHQKVILHKILNYFKNFRNYNKIQ